MNAIALSIGKVTHIGQVRSRNEDAMGLRQASKDDEVSLFVVADGMGGHSAGNVASQMAVEATLSGFFGAIEGDASERLRQAVEGANRQIWDAAQSNPDYFRMGTTIVSAAVLGNQADIANVGDSRLYLVRGGKIEQVTRDHSWVALQVELGELTAEEAAQSLNRSVLLRCLGEKSDVLVDMVRIRLRVGDILVLCSDGLHGLVTPDEICQAVLRVDPQQASDELVELANARGGTDNITVQVVRIDACPPPPEGEGEELVIHRLSHSDLLDDEPAPTPPPLAPPTAPLFASPRSNPAPAPYTPPLPPPPPHHGGQVPWVLLALALMAGAVIMAVLDRTVLIPGSAPATTSVASSAMPSDFPSVVALPTSFASETPSSVQSGGLSSPLPSASANGQGGASPQDGRSAPYSGRFPRIGGELSKGQEVLQRFSNLESPMVTDGALYWIEDDRLWRAPLASPRGVAGKVAPVSVYAGHIDAVSGGAAGPLYAASDDGEEILQLKSIPLTQKLKASHVEKTSGPIQMLAANAHLLAWVEERAQETIQVRPVVGGRYVPRAIATKDDEVLAIALPPGAKTVYWADRNRLYEGEKALPFKTAGSSLLAADATHLYWTDGASAGDEPEVTIRRCRLDGLKTENVQEMHVAGPLTGLAADDGFVYAVKPEAEQFKLLRYVFPK